MNWTANKDRWSAAAIVVVMIGFFSWYIPTDVERSRAHWALYHARNRMALAVKEAGVEATGDIVPAYIACGNTTDSIGCVMGKDGKIVVTYFSGDNLHKQAYRSEKVWIDWRPHVLHEEIDKY